MPCSIFCLSTAKRLAHTGQDFATAASDEESYGDLSEQKKTRYREQLVQLKLWLLRPR